MFEYYENATFGALSAYICELTLKGHSDNEIAIYIYTRWSYLFKGMTWADWFGIVEEFRKYQAEGNVPVYKEPVRIRKNKNACAGVWLGE